MSNVNQLNQNYYTKHGTKGVPDLLATAEPIQESIRLMIESTVPHDPIRVLELGFGSRFDRYEHIFTETKRIWEATLTDFDIRVLPKDNRVTTAQFDLLNDPFPTGTYDAILSTYTFDSIEFPEDTPSYPGGLIKTALAAMDHLSPTGFFLTIDKNTTQTVHEFEPAGGALFKPLDLQVAVTTLMHKGLKTELVLLDDFLERFGQSLPFTLSDHGCLIVRR